VNESYFGWNQPIYAMQDGTVLYVLNTTPDNDGNLQNRSFNMNANAVIMQNAAGQYDLFFHFRQGSIVVNVGQAVTRGTLLGRVGNSGLSLLPHLHVQSYALDSTGFAKSLGQSFLNLQTIQGAHVTGIPAAGVYQTQ
jgi:murein DD-endopeptidase MepM/ murein hydrolase activator NlpD